VISFVRVQVANLFYVVVIVPVSQHPF